MNPPSQQGNPVDAQAAVHSSPSISMPAIVPPTVVNAAPSVSEQSLDSIYNLPHTIPKKTGINLLLGKPLLIGLGTVLGIGLLIVGITFMLNKPTSTGNSSISSSDKTILEALANPGKELQDSEFSINLPTTVTGQKFVIQDADGSNLFITDPTGSRIGIGGFPEGEAKLQVLGDIMASGTLLASGGSTMLSDQGLRIGSVLVCTAAGCIAAPSSTPVPSTSTSTTTIIAPERPLDADTLQGSNAAFFLNASNLSSGTLDDSRLSVNVTKAGNTFNGPLQLVMTNASGELPAISGINLTNINAATLGGNNTSYYTNASNLSTGTVGDGRLSGNVAMRNGFNTFQAASNSTTSFQIQNAAGTATIFRADTTNDKIFANHLDLSGPGNNVVVLTLPSAAGSTTIRGAAAGDFFGTYISGNIKVDGDIGTSIIRPNQASDVGLTVRGRASQSGNLLNLRDNNNTVLASVSGTGNALFQAATNSATAFQIQNAAGTSNLFIADTTNSRIGIGATPANGLLTIGTNTTAASGGLYFGSDTNLYRSAADTLRTDDNLFVATQIRADSVQIGLSSANGLWSASGTLDLLAGSGIRFGSSSDTNLYRATADELRTDDRFHVQRAVNAAAFSSNIAGDGFSRWILNSGGVMSWGDGTATQDTNLYRGGADSLNTDDLFQVTRGLSTSPALAALVSGDTVSRFAINADGKQEWGAGNAARDVSLYRSAANTLKTDDEFVVSGNPLTINGGFLQGIRASGTDDFLKVQLGAEGFYRFQADASGSLLWGSGAGVGDTNLYRSSANVLATDNNFRINGANVAFDHRGSTTTSQLTFRQRLSGDTNDRFSILSNGRMDWGPGNLAQDTNLYRSGAGTLMTDGALTIGTTLNAATLQQGGTGVLLTSSSSGGDLSGTFSNLQLAASVVTTTEIFDGTIMNADISASAAIGVSKLAAGSNGQVLGVVGGVVTWVDSGVPAGAVNFFNLASCPTGWSELTGARGRYLIGLPASGTLAGTNGTALTNLEDRAVGQHSHGVTGSPGISDPGHSHPFSASVPTTTGGASTNLGGSPGVTTISGTNSSTTGITVNAGTLGTANTGSVAGTNAPYIQLLVCQKS